MKKKAKDSGGARGCEGGIESEDADGKGLKRTKERWHRARALTPEGKKTFFTARTNGFFGPRTGCWYLPFKSFSYIHPALSLSGFRTLSRSPTPCQWFSPLSYASCTLPSASPNFNGAAPSSRRSELPSHRGMPGDLSAGRTPSHPTF